MNPVATEEKMRRSVAVISDRALRLYFLTAPILGFYQPEEPGKSTETEKRTELGYRIKYLNSMTNEQRSELLDEIRDNEFPLEQDIPEGEAQSTIGAYIETLEDILEKLESSDETEPTASERLESLSRIRIKELDWHTYMGLKQEEFNQVISPLNLLKHEHEHISNLIRFSASMLNDSVAFEDLDEEKRKLTLESISQNINLSANNSINLLRLVDRFVKGYFTREESSDEYKITELMSTFIGKKPEELSGTSFSLIDKDIQINFDFEDSDCFDSFEEFISIRTLIYNAITLPSVKNVTVRRSKIQETGGILYSVEDDGEIKTEKQKEGFEKFAESLKKYSSLGSKYKDEPILIEQRGGKIVALMAGTQGGKAWAEIDPDTNLKCVYVLFSNRHAGSKEVSRTQEENYLQEEPELVA